MQWKAFMLCDTIWMKLVAIDSFCNLESHSIHWKCSSSLAWTWNVCASNGIPFTVQWRTFLMLWIRAGGRKTIECHTWSIDLIVWFVALFPIGFFLFMLLSAIIQSMHFESNDRFNRMIWIKRFNLKSIGKTNKKEFKLKNRRRFDYIWCEKTNQIHQFSIPMDFLIHQSIWPKFPIFSHKSHKITQKNANNQVDESNYNEFTHNSWAHIENYLFNTFALSNRK